MKVITEEIRQGDKVTGSVTTISHNGVKIELRPWTDEGAVLIAEIARRCEDPVHVGSVAHDGHLLGLLALMASYRPDSAAFIDARARVLAYIDEEQIAAAKKMQAACLEALWHLPSARSAIEGIDAGDLLRRMP